MTASGLLTVSPQVEGSKAAGIAAAIEALEGYDVAYETTGMGTLLEAESAGELFAAAQAAHEAVEEKRVVTTLKVDDKRASTESLEGKVAAVESELGRSPRGGPD